jgi:tetratricopeptide (TPR) repeat protein
MARFTGVDVREKIESAFMQAMEQRRADQLDEARELLERIVETEPRFPEPYLELALISHAGGLLERAIDEARLGLEMLEEYGQWVEDIPPDVLLGHARVVLAQLLIEAAEATDLATNRAEFLQLWNEGAELFSLALEADPSNSDAVDAATRYRPVRDK